MLSLVTRRKIKPKKKVPKNNGYFEPHTTNVLWEGKEKEFLIYIFIEICIILSIDSKYLSLSMNSN